MAKETDIVEFRNRLHSVFCESNKAEKKYSEVWLSDADFSGLYNSGKFIVNVKAEHEIDSCNDEIKHVVAMLYDKLNKEDISLVWRVVVFNSFEMPHCASDDILVYPLAEAC